MKKMTGMFLMILGALVFCAGLLIYLQGKKQNQPTTASDNLNSAINMAVADGVLTNNERKIIKEIAEKENLDYNAIIQEAEQQIASAETQSETEIIDVNKKQGDDFEKFVIQKFDKKYFTVKEWAGDKYVNGTYAQTTPMPDLLMEMQLGNKTAQFWVECKWRKELFKGGIEFASPEQFDRYKKYQDEKNIPVFIAIGLGGNGESPERLYVLPLNQLKFNFIYLSYLQKFEKNIESNFYFNIQEKILQ